MAQDQPVPPTSAVPLASLLPRATHSAPDPRPATLQHTRMRGGLGRTLLTAFLLLTIGPLSAISLYAIHRTQQAGQQQRAAQLALVAESYRAHLLLVGDLLFAPATPAGATGWWQVADGWQPARGNADPLPTWLNRAVPPGAWQVGGSPPTLWLSAPHVGGWRGTTLPLPPLLETLKPSTSVGASAVYIQHGATLLPLTEGGSRPPPGTIDQVTTLERGAPLRLPSEQGQGVQTWVRVPLRDGLALLVARTEPAAPSTPDGLAAALVAATLVVALVTTVAAAFVTRQITRPLYELTVTASHIAQGNLTQRAKVKQQNELGILALAFNTMAAQLQETLETLEERVAQRTMELQRANQEIRARAHQLEMSAEIGAVLSNIHELERLLEQGARLIGTAFGYRNVSIWLLGRRAGRAPGLTLRAALDPDALGAADAQALAEQAQAGGAALSTNQCTLALPLRLADNVLGSLVITQPQPLGKRDSQHLQILADTFAVAIENARASEMEREAGAKMRQLEAHRAQFLGEMSHELSTALNSIIGFSHLMLKEIEGPLTDMQRSDLTYINRNGTHLITLLDGMLDVVEGSGGQVEGSGKDG